MKLLLLQFYFHNCDVGSHTRTQRKYCMLTYHFILTATCFVRRFTPKHAAKPTKENTSCVSTGDSIIFSFTLAFIGSYWNEVGLSSMALLLTGKLSFLLPAASPTHIRRRGVFWHSLLEMMSRDLRTRNHLSPCRVDVSWPICLIASRGLCSWQLVRLVPISVTTITHAACGMKRIWEMALKHADISNSTVWVTIYPTSATCTLNRLWPSG